MVTCCKDCSERRVGCHAACDRYTQEAARNVAQRQARWAQNQARADAERIEIDRAIKARRRRGR